VLDSQGTLCAHESIPYSMDYHVIRLMLVASPISDILPPPDDPTAYAAPSQTKVKSAFTFCQFCNQVRFIVELGAPGATNHVDVVEFNSAAFQRSLICLKSPPILLCQARIGIWRSHHFIFYGAGRLLKECRSTFSYYECSHCRKDI
jgi:hypothetical protein